MIDILRHQEEKEGLIYLMVGDDGTYERHYKDNDRQNKQVIVDSELFSDQTQIILGSSFRLYMTLF